MKLAVFVALISLSISTSTLAQTGRIGPDFLKGLEADADRERRATQEKKPASAPAPKAVPLSEYMARIEANEALKRQQAERERKRAAAAATAREAEQVAKLAVRSQSAVAMTPCPPYVVHDYSQAAALFAFERFPNPTVTAVDFRPAVVKADYEFNPTVIIDSKSGWSTKDVTDALARTSKIYSQCGIRIGAATVVSGTYAQSVRPFDVANQGYIAHHMPASAPKPWMFFIDKRANNEFSGGAGTSVAQTTESTGNTFVGSTKYMRASAFIARDSVEVNGRRTGYTPELVVGHELAHILTDGDHQPGENGDSKNLLAGSGELINAKITSTECAQMRKSPYVRKLN